MHEGQASPKAVLPERFRGGSPWGTGTALPGEPALGQGLPLHTLETAPNTCFPRDLASPLGESTVRGRDQRLS